jgi:hypothetical protein
MINDINTFPRIRLISSLNPISNNRSPEKLDVNENIFGMIE